MVRVKMRVGGKTYYSVNSFRISAAALESIGLELFTPEGWQQIQESLSTLGYAKCNLQSEGVTPEPFRRGKI